MSTSDKNLSLITCIGEQNNFQTPEGKGRKGEKLEANGETERNAKIKGYIKANAKKGKKVPSKGGGRRVVEP